MVMPVVENKKPRKRRCPVRIAVGSYLLATGIVVALGFWYYQVTGVFDGSVRPIADALTLTVFTIWILGGLWVLLLGIEQPCPEKFE
jgi:hypothetical protein